MFPSQAWCRCPCARHGSGSQAHPLTSAQAYSEWTLRNVPCSAFLFPLELSKCLSCWVHSCRVRQHIFHGDFCVCTCLRVLLISINPCQAHFVLWHAMAHEQKNHHVLSLSSPEDSLIYCRVSLLLILVNTVVTKILQVWKPQQLEARWLAVFKFHFKKSIPNPQGCKEIRQEIWMMAM